VLIEHNLEVVKTADRIIAPGPEDGGEIVVQSTPEEVAKVARSYTGQYLKPLLKGIAPGTDYGVCEEEVVSNEQQIRL